MRPTPLAALSLLAWAAYSEIASAQPQTFDSDAPGFSLPAFNPNYPGETFVYQGPEARRLAREILPVGARQITRAVVHTRMGLPSGGYLGLTIDFAFEVRTAPNSICEEPHVFLSLSYERKSALSKEMRLSVNGGNVAGHSLEDVRTGGRYKSLPEAPSSNEALLEACRSLAADTSDWRHAGDLDDFASKEWRQRELAKAIRTLPWRRIRCTGIDGSPCKYERADLLALIENTPPDHSQKIFVPDEGWLYVYRYLEPDVPVGRDYTVTMRTAFQDRPAMIDIRFSRNGRPVV